MYVDSSTGNLYAVGNYDIAGLSNGYIVKFGPTGAKIWESWSAGTAGQGLVYNDLFVKSGVGIHVVGTETAGTETYTFVGEHTDGTSSTSLTWSDNPGTTIGTDTDQGLSIALNASTGSNEWATGQPVLGETAVF